MAVFHWGQAWQQFRDLERQVDELLRTIPFSFPVIRVERHYPPINIYDLPDQVLVTAEVPGVAREGLEITFAQGVLTLKGKRDSAQGVGDERFRRNERFWGDWQRAISINERIREDQVSAEMADGILKVRLPKGEETKPRHIPVAADT